MNIKNLNFNQNLVIIIITITIVGLRIQECNCNNGIESEIFTLGSGINESRGKRSAEAGKSLIPPNYNSHELPPQIPDNVTEMRFSVLIMGVRDIKEITEEIAVEMNMYMRWRDSRFDHFVQDSTDNEFIVLKPNLLADIWHPDIFFENLKQVNQPTVVSKPASLRIYNDSSLRYSARIAVTVACEMMFYYYPSDTQRCNIDLKSYAYNDNQLRLFWHEADGAKFGKRIVLSNFYLGLEKPSTFSFTTVSGTFPGLRFTIVLERKLSFHLIQTYIPSSLLVAVSWLSFLVPPDSVPGRMAICVTCLLTLIAMFASVRQMVPNVSYIKALDIWMVFCVFFVFIALAEFTIVLKLLSIKRFKARHQESSTTSPSMIELKEQLPPPASSDKNQAKGREIVVQEEFVYKPLVAKIEKGASIVVPSLFILFNFIYWSWLLSSDSHQPFVPQG